MRHGFVLRAAPAPRVARNPTEDERRNALHRLCHELVPGGRLEVDGLSWRISISGAAMLTVHACLHGGESSASPFPLASCFAAGTPRRGQSDEDLARDLLAEVREHIDALHEDILAASATLRASGR